MDTYEQANECFSLAIKGDPVAQGELALLVDVMNALQYLPILALQRNEKAVELCKRFYAKSAPPIESQGRREYLSKQFLSLLVAAEAGRGAPGVLYVWGKIMAKSDNSGWQAYSRTMFESAAKKGQADAQWEMGNLYFETNEYSDDKLAVEWWIKSAEQGNLDGLCALGIAYACGRGVLHDADKAKECFWLAAPKHSDVMEYLEAIREAEYLSGMFSQSDGGAPELLLKIVLAMASLKWHQDIS